MTAIANFYLLHLDFLASGRRRSVLGDIVCGGGEKKRIIFIKEKKNAYQQYALFQSEYEKSKLFDQGRYDHSSVPLLKYSVPSFPMTNKAAFFVNCVTSLVIGSSLNSFSQSVP